MPHCPVCDANLGAQLCPGKPEATPEPGDYSVCVYCQTPLRYAAVDPEPDFCIGVSKSPLVLVTLNEADILEMPPGLARSMKFLRKLKAEHSTDEITVVLNELYHEAHHD